MRLSVIVAGDNARVILAAFIRCGGPGDRRGETRSVIPRRSVEMPPVDVSINGSTLRCAAERVAIVCATESFSSSLTRTGAKSPGGKDSGR